MFEGEGSGIGGTAQGTGSLDFILTEEVTSECPEGDIVTLSSRYTSTEHKIHLQRALNSLTPHTMFKPTQLESIKRTLSFESSLVVAPTGGGKSVCYTLPTYILKQTAGKSEHGICLVISPTLSLMHDQMRVLPFGLNGKCLSGETGMQQSNRDFSEVDVVFVSPERACSEAFLELVRTSLPRV